MDPASLTWTRVVKIWWCYAWRSALISVLVYFIITFVAGLLIGLSGVDEKFWPVIFSIIMIVTGCAISIVVLRSAIDNQYSDFHLEIVKDG